MVTKTRLGVLKRQVQSLIAHQVTLHKLPYSGRELSSVEIHSFTSVTLPLVCYATPPPTPSSVKNFGGSKCYKRVKVEQLRLLELWLCLPSPFQASWTILKICSTITSPDRQLVGGMCGECVQYFLTWQCSIVKEFFKGLFTWYRNDFHSGTSSFHLLIFTKTTLSSCTSHSGMRSRRFSIRNSCSGATFHSGCM